MLVQVTSRLTGYQTTLRVCQEAVKGKGNTIAFVHRWLEEVTPGDVARLGGYGRVFPYKSPTLIVDGEVTEPEPVAPDNNAIRTPPEPEAHDETNKPHRKQMAQRVPVDEKVSLQEQAHAHLAQVRETRHEASAAAQLELF